MTNGSFVTTIGAESVAGVMDLPLNVTFEKTVALNGITSLMSVHSNEKKIFVYFSASNNALTFSGRSGTCLLCGQRSDTR